MESGLSQPVGTQYCHSLTRGSLQIQYWQTEAVSFYQKLVSSLHLGNFPTGMVKKSFIGRKVVLCKKSIKAQRFVVFSENDTRFPCPSVISLGYGRLLNGVSWGIVPRCQELHSKPLHAWALGLPCLSIMCSHHFPIQAQFLFFYVQKPYTVLLVHLQCPCCMYLWFCSSRSCASALTSALASIDRAWSQARIWQCENKARHPTLLQHLKLFFLLCGLPKIRLTLGLE